MKTLWMLSLLALVPSPRGWSAASGHEPVREKPDRGMPDRETPVREEPAPAQTAYDGLLLEYQAAVKALRAQIQAAQGAKEKAALRKNHPAKAFWPRFEALAQGGEGRAWLWKVSTQRERGVPRKQRDAERLDAYTRLLKDYPKAPWLATAMEQVAKDGKVDSDLRVRLFQHVANRHDQSESHRTLARFHAGHILFTHKDPTKQPLGKAMLEALVQEDPKSALALRAQVILEKPDLTVGSMAPDFIGKTIDGKQLQLSDYRGKVVLIDFFGFW